jgi:aspartate/methionine/tyrosine aminotransferase
MNKLALELNEALRGTPVERLFSHYGRRIFFPNGIPAQAAEAGTKAKNHNATIGAACSHGKSMILPTIAGFMPSLTPDEAVSYAPTPGDAAMRQVWLKEMARKNPSLDTTKITLPVIVPGLTNGISTLADLFIDKDDRVVVPDLYWENYDLIIQTRREAEVATFPFFKNGGLNTEGYISAMRKNIVDNKVITILNFPNNPTGYTPTVAEAHEIVKGLIAIADEGTTVMVICDDAYFGLFYEDTLMTESVFALLANAHKNILAVKVDGPTKEDLVWGFRSGFLTFGSAGLSPAHYDALMKKVVGTLRATISNCSRPAQSILKKALEMPGYQKEKEAFLAQMKSRYLKVKEVLKKHASDESLEALPFNSGYFMSFKTKLPAETIRQKLLNEEGIGTIAITEHTLRVAYCSIDEENIEALYAAIYRQSH